MHCVVSLFNVYMKCIDDDGVGVENDFRPMKREEKQQEKCIDVNVNEGEHSNHIYKRAQRARRKMNERRAKKFVLAICDVFCNTLLCLIIDAMALV